MRLASGITLLNVLVASGFAIAGLIKPEAMLPAGVVPTEASVVFALYAAARTLPLAIAIVIAIARRATSALIVLGLLAGFIQFVDAAVGLYQHDLGKTVGPLVLGALQLYAVALFRKNASSAVV
ncbi:MAG: hypothetical protein M3Y12_09085 [Bacteroidota bacterium]|nr:hypothetical protein [Bacteroidota bacterium]